VWSVRAMTPNTIALDIHLEARLGENDPALEVMLEILKFVLGKAATLEVRSANGEQVATPTEAGKSGNTQD